MTKDDLVKDWVMRYSMTREKAERYVDDLYWEFCSALVDGGEVQFRGIGTWTTTVRQNGRRVIRMRPSRSLLATANETLQPEKYAEASSVPILQQPSTRIPLLIAHLFDRWPHRDFLDQVGDIAGTDSPRLLHLLEEAVAACLHFDPDSPGPFLEFLKAHLR